MAYAGARLAAATFRAVGIDAQPAPDSDARTLELGGLNVSGEECLPHKITVGDFLKVCEQPGFEPAKTAFFMPTAQGPCRFGQYGPYLRRLLDEKGLHDTLVFSPTSNDGYQAVGIDAGEVVRTMWMGIVAGDVATKFLLKTRAYETQAGRSDAAFVESVDQMCAVLERPGLRPQRRLRKLVGQIEAMRDRFRAVPADYRKGRPLVGLVGEIFCRLNTFSNDDTARRIEKLGGECWLSDIAEWVWYVNWNFQDKTTRQRGRFNLPMLKHKLKTHVQHRYEQAIYGPVHEDLVGYQEAKEVTEILDASAPYLPSRGCIGEMVLSVGKAVYLYRNGADGIIDISPFTCMNGIICEAVYPTVSQDCEGIPIRSLYFDGVNTHIERDLEIFLDLARAYQLRKTKSRTYPAYFI